MKSDSTHHFFADRTILGARLRWWRATRELKIESAARELGVCTATWGHWETGHTFPSGEMLLALCNLTELPLQLLLCPHMETCPYHRTGRIPPADALDCDHRECPLVSSELDLPG